MIDTVKIGLDYSMTPLELKGWREKHGRRENGFTSHSHTYSVIAPNGCKVTCVYYPIGFRASPVLTLEFSLPKLLYGNNVQSVANLDSAIAQANDLISTLPGIPSLNISDGELLRLDIAYNHQVGKEVTSYLHHLSGLKQSRRKTIYYQHDTVYFKNKTVTTKYYDKHKQSGLSAAKGLLRQEITFTNKQRIRELFELETLGDLSFVPIVQQLENDLAILHLNRPIPHKGHYNWKTLVEDYGQYAGIYYYGLLGLAKIYPILEIAEDTNRHHRSIDRQVQNALATTNGKPVPLDGYLPALNIDVDVVSDKQIVFRDTAHA